MLYIILVNLFQAPEPNLPNNIQEKIHALSYEATTVTPYITHAGHSRTYYFTHLYFRGFHKHPHE